MRTFLITSVLVFLVSVSIPFSASATTCQPGYDERDDGSGCDLQSTAPPSTVRDSVTPRGTDTNITLINPLNTGECAPNGNCLMNFLNRILEFVIRIGTVVVVLMTVYVGYLFVVAQGNSTKIEEAKNALLWTVVGALILLGSKAISEAIKATVQAISVGQ